MPKQDFLNAFVQQESSFFKSQTLNLATRRLEEVLRYNPVLQPVPSLMMEYIEDKHALFHFLPIHPAPASFEYFVEYYPDFRAMILDQAFSERALNNAEADRRAGIYELYGWHRMAITQISLRPIYEPLKKYELLLNNVLKTVGLHPFAGAALVMASLYKKRSLS